ncbi:hypothetical protein B0H14DRAFT_3896370 [Mycena olivaceomarginata]|nr:hypothetical protein B0H14DRAFT_3896370 [Mycena olivaceomarginata]
MSRAASSPTFTLPAALPPCRPPRTAPTQHRHCLKVKFNVPALRWWALHRLFKVDCTTLPAHAMLVPAPVIPFLSSLPFLFLPRFSRLLPLISCPTRLSLSCSSLEPADVDHAGAPDVFSGVGLCQSWGGPTRSFA